MGVGKKPKEKKLPKVDSKDCYRQDDESDDDGEGEVRRLRLGNRLEMGRGKGGD